MRETSMSNRRLIITGLVAAAVAALFLAAYFIVSHLDDKPYDIHLANTSVDPIDGSGSSDTDLYKRLDITTENVREVVGTIVRPGSYSRDVTVSRYWTGGQQDTVLNTACNNGVSGTYCSDTGKHTVDTPEKTYVWYDGSDIVYEYAPSNGYRNADENAMLITYEDVVSLRPEMIVSAGYGEYCGERCISVSYKSDRLDYITTCHISIDTGLVLGAEIFSGEFKVYGMASSNYTESPEDLSLLKLPDGTDLTLH